MNFHAEAASARGLDLPVTSVAAAEVGDHFGWIGAFFALDGPYSSQPTREFLAWSPDQPGLIEDLGEGHYFAAGAGHLDLAGAARRTAT
jgi:hypothetical protein